MPIVFVTGIDTGVGKTYASGLLARFLYKQGLSVITQKLAQTGCTEKSEDIELHRKIMGTDFGDDDREGLTCPYVFKFPSSPHLAAKLEKTQIDVDVITKATKSLAEKYEYVIIEGVGGINVPITGGIMVIDYIASTGYPVIIVSSSKLGSINHTILTIDALLNRNIDICGIIYNNYPEEDVLIADDSREVIKRYLTKNKIFLPIYSPLLPAAGAPFL
ncbi:dethiobiotin synthase [Spirochaetota bacterium]